jgi:hypothetical protein
VVFVDDAVAVHGLERKAPFALKGFRQLGALVGVGVQPGGPGFARARSAAK